MAVISATPENWSGASASRTITFSGAMTNPSLIVVLIAYESDTATISSVTDDRSNSYSAAVSHAYGYSANHATSAIYYAQNTQTSAATVTVTLSSSTEHGRVWAYEVTGRATSSVVDATGTCSMGDTPLSIEVTTTQANSAMFSIGSGYSSAGITNDTGYTAASGSPFNYWNQYQFAEYDEDVDAAGTKTLTYGASANKQGAAVAAAFKILAAGGGITIANIEHSVGRGEFRGQY